MEVQDFSGRPNWKWTKEEVEAEIESILVHRDRTALTQLLSETEKWTVCRKSLQTKMIQLLTDSSKTRRGRSQSDSKQSYFYAHGCNVRAKLDGKKYSESWSSWGAGPRQARPMDSSRKCLEPLVSLQYLRSGSIKAAGAHSEPKSSHFKRRALLQFQIESRIRECIEIKNKGDEKIPRNREDRNEYARVKKVLEYFFIEADAETFKEQGVLFRISIPWVPEP